MRGRGARLTARALLALGMLGGATGAQTQSPPPALPLFSQDEILTLRITAPLRELMRSDAEQGELDATVEIDDPIAGPISLPVEIRVRGVSRLALCGFPPLRLDFASEGTAGTIFEGQDKLKLVTPCERQTSYREYIALEFLIYRMLNVLTDHSLRVRPANIEFVSTDSRRADSFVERAFFIEDRREAASRLGLDEIDADSLSLAALDAPHTALLGLFHYLIGNTDFALLRGPDGEPCCHNGMIVGRGDRDLFVLPYDFDQAGLINTEYAVPNESLRIRSVRERVYRGFCAMNAELDPVVERFSEQRASLESLFDDDAIGERLRQRSLDYIAAFYDVVDDPELRESLITERCRD